jgi:hypothetical protein
MPWSEIQEFIQQFGWVKGVFTVFFFMSHAWIWRLYTGRLADRQKEIDRLAAENRDYRERFLMILDEKRGYQKPTPAALPNPQAGKKKKGEH